MNDPILDHMRLLNRRSFLGTAGLGVGGVALAGLLSRDALAANTAHRARYAAAPEDATKLITFGDSKPDPALPAPELAAWTLTAGLLLNLDETLNR